MNMVADSSKIFNSFTLRCFLIIAKSAYYIRRVRPSARSRFYLFTHLSAASPMGQIFTKLISDTLWKSVEEIQIWLKLGKHFGRFAWRRVFYCWRRHIITSLQCVSQKCENTTLLRLHGNNGHAKAPYCYVTERLPIFLVKALNRAQ
jgi:hypothetical protein